MIAMPLTKRVEINMSIQVCIISRINFDYKKKGENKAFLANQKHHYHVSQCGEHHCRANNKKNGDCYGYPTLSRFLDEL